MMKYNNEVLSMPNYNRNSAVLIVTALIAAALDIGASFLLRDPDLGRAARIAIALIPVPGNLALIALVLRGIRKLDDFQKRIHFEAVTVAFLSTGVAVFVYAYLQNANAVGPLNMELVWAFMLIFYAIGYLIARSHYK
jgi:hypothetical protein